MIPIHIFAFSVGLLLYTPRLSRKYIASYNYCDIPSSAGALIDSVEPIVSGHTRQYGPTTHIGIEQNSVTRRKWSGSRN